ncbi:hypothetical protein OAG71_00070 [bacterium]|nr:hypothetical protein [bacterium]
MSHKSDEQLRRLSIYELALNFGVDLPLAPQSRSQFGFAADVCGDRGRLGNASRGLVFDFQV